MNKAYIPKNLRNEVEQLANHRCEYCLTPAIVTVYSLQVDHNIPEKQGGPTLTGNLTLSCRPCNVCKGYTVVRCDYKTDSTVWLFYSRKQKRSEQFLLLPTGTIMAKKYGGKAIIEVLRLNDQIRIEDWAALIELSLLQSVT